MGPLVFGTILDAASKVLDRVLPDPAARAAAEIELLRLQQAGGLAQIEVNKTEAASSSIFVAGWRPAAGWVCVGALTWEFVARPMLVTGFGIAGHPVPEIPRLDGVLWELLFGMLGLGSLRTVEKIKGAA